MNVAFERPFFMARKSLSTLLFCLAVFGGGDVAPAIGAESEKLTYYVQLVRGNNEADAPEPGAHRIGPKLAKKLRPVFRWESYWEINRKSVAIEPGKKTRLRLSMEREVEIDLTDAAHRTVTAFQSGKPVCGAKRPIGEGMTIVGGDRNPNSVWFIVVRRDKPGD
jgi:hypothetical protein